MLGNNWYQLLYCSLTATLFLPIPGYELRSRQSYGYRNNRCSKIAFPNGLMALKHRGRVAKFTCNLGYKLIGDRIATCHVKVWDTVPNCVKDVVCPDELPKVMNGKMVEFEFVYYNVICNAGYELPEGSTNKYPCEIFSRPEMKSPVCQLTDANFCDFEEDLCGWNNTIPYFSWIRYQNATPSHELHTGPSADHTDGKGHYLYIEASGLPDNEERYAKLTRRFLKIDSPEVCFIFWYHMYGFNIGTLDVYVDHLKVFSKSGNLGEKWRKGIIQKLPSDRDFYISLVATTSNGFAGDIAIDDIGLVNSTECTKKLLIETTCKDRCFDQELNDTLCKCSSECLIESTCCPDFMRLCSAEELSTHDVLGLIEQSTDSSSSVMSGSSTGFVSYEYDATSESWTTILEIASSDMEDKNEPTGEPSGSSASYTTEAFSETQQFNLVSAVATETTNADDSMSTSTENGVALSSPTIEYVPQFNFDASDSTQVQSFSEYLSTNQFNPSDYIVSSSTARRTRDWGFSVKTTSPLQTEMSVNFTREIAPSSTIAKHTTTTTNAPKTLPTRKLVTKSAVTTKSSTVNISSTNGPISRHSTTKASNNVTPQHSSTTQVPKATYATVKTASLESLGSASTSPACDDQDDYDFDIFGTSAPVTKSVPLVVTKPNVPQSLTTSVPIYYRTLSGNQEWKKTFVPKGRYTFSAVKSETRTTTYVSILGVFAFLLVAALAGYLFRRRRTTRFHDSTEESDALYMSNEEMLNFNVAGCRRLGEERSGNSQQMSHLIQTEHLLD